MDPWQRPVAEGRGQRLQSSTPLRLWPGPTSAAPAANPRRRRLARGPHAGPFSAALPPLAETSAPRADWRAWLAAIRPRTPVVRGRSRENLPGELAQLRQPVAVTGSGRIGGDFKGLRNFCEGQFTPNFEGHDIAVKVGHFAHGFLD